MKKLFGLIVLLALVWAGSSWWIGEQTEQTVRQQLAAHPGQELISYQRSFFGARAVTRLPVHNILLNRWFADVQLVHDIKHGPLIWNGKPVFALSQWTSRIDSSALDSAAQTTLATAFNGLEPLLATTTIGFDQQVQVDAQLNPLDLTLDDAGGSLKLEPVQIQGQWALSGDSAPLQLRSGSIEWRDPDMSISVPALQLDGQLGTLAGTPALEQFQVKADALALRIAGDPQAMQMDVALKVENAQQDANLRGTLQLQANNVQGSPAGIRQLLADLDYAGLNAAGLETMAALQEQIQALQDQLNWNEEGTQLPEGQQQQTQLMMQLQEVSARLLENLFNKVLTADQSTVKASVQLETEKGRLDALADLGYHGSGKAVRFDDLLLQGPQEWGNMLRGTLSVGADKAVVDDDLSLLLAWPMQQKAIVEQDGRYRMDLKLPGDQAELNGVPVDFADLPGRFFPQPPAIDEQTSMGIPPDIMRQIETNGFTDDIMQQLEESDDVTAEHKQLLRQLHQMSKGLQ